MFAERRDLSNGEVTVEGVEDTDHRCWAVLGHRSKSWQAWGSTATLAGRAEKFQPGRHSSGRSANVPLSSEHNSLPRAAVVTQAFMGSILGGACKSHIAFWK